jgi:hypothetical protein
MYSNSEEKSDCGKNWFPPLHFTALPFWVRPWVPGKFKHIITYVDRGMIMKIVAASKKEMGTKEKR